MGDTLKSADLTLAYTTHSGKIDTAQFYANEATKFKELLLKLNPLIYGLEQLTDPDQDSGFSRLRVFVSPESNLSQVRSTVPDSFNNSEVMALHSLLLRDLRKTTPVLKYLSTNALHLLKPAAPGVALVISLVFYAAGSITTNVVREIYPKPYSALQVFRSEGNSKFSKADIQGNLRLPDCSLTRMASPSSLVRQKLWNKDNIVPFRIHLSLSKGVNSGSRYIIMDKFHLNQLQHAKGWFKIDSVSKDADDMDPFRIKTLTSKLLTIYERADVYASDSSISSSAKGSLLLPLLNDIFSDRGRFEEDQVISESDNEGDLEDDSDEGDEDESNSEDEDDPESDDEKKHRGDTYFVFHVKEDQAGFTFTLNSPSKLESKIQKKVIYITFRPDSMIVFHGIPVIFCEVDSNNFSQDHFRMIGQACGVNRLLNMYGITAGDTDEVITIAIYLDKSMVVTVHILSSKYDPAYTAEAKNIPVHKETIKFHLCSHEKIVSDAQDGNQRMKKIPSEAVKLVKFLHDTRTFLDEMYPKDKRVKFSEVIQAANDFSTVVRSCSDATSASKAASSARASKSKSASSKNTGNPTTRSGSASKPPKQSHKFHATVPEDKEI